MKDCGVAVSGTATQTLDHVRGSLELILHILQIPTLSQSGGRLIPYKHLEDSTVKGRGDGITGVAFNFISIKQIQLGVNMA